MSSSVPVKKSNIAVTAIQAARCKKTEKRSAGRGVSVLLYDMQLFGTAKEVAIKDVLMYIEFASCHDCPFVSQFLIIGLARNISLRQVS